ncbi:hypothetical protein C8Q76DRAFT_589389, partial [Earliella scabrosa]
MFTDMHPQRDTHLVRQRVIWVVPVILGDRIPRNDRSVKEKEEWARAMLILFVPWRDALELKDDDESWLDAFDRRSAGMSQAHLNIINNMNVLCECRDARDNHRRINR